MLRLMLATSLLVLFAACAAEPEVEAGPASNDTRIEGRVELADRADPTGTQIVLAGTESVAFADGAGAFRFRDVPAGRWQLLARHEGYLDATAGPFDLGATGKVDAGTIVLATESSTLGVVSGRATLAGAARAGIELFLAGTSHATSTDDDGIFRVDGLQPGTYLLGGRYPGWIQEGLVSIRIERGESLEGVALNLIPDTATSGGLDGTARILGASNHDGIRVSVLDEHEERASALTDASGAYHFPSLPVGVYALRIEKSPLASVVLPNVPVAAPSTTAPDVTLQRGRRIDERVLESLLLTAGGTRAALQLADERSSAIASYDLDSRALVQLAGEATLHAIAADGSAATISLGGALLRLDFATGAVAPVTPPPAAILAEVGSFVVYRSALGDLYIAGGGASEGTLIGEARCDDAALTEASPLFPDARGGYWLLRWEPRCGAWGAREAIVEASGRLISDQFDDILRFEDSMPVYLVKWPEDFNDSSLYMIDPFRHREELVLLKLTSTFPGESKEWGRIRVRDWGYHWVKLDPATGSSTVLAANVSPWTGHLSGPGLVAVQALDAGEVRLLDFRDGSSTRLCGRADKVVAFFHANRVACVDGTVLRLVDQAGRATVLSTALLSPNLNTSDLEAGSTLSWQESAGWKGIHLADPSTVTAMGSATSISSATVQSDTAVKAWFVTDGMSTRLDVVRYATASRHTIVDGAAGSWWPSCYFSANGQLGVCTYSFSAASAGDPRACAPVGAGETQRCIVAFDTDSGSSARLQVASTWNVDIHYASDATAGLIHVADRVIVVRRDAAGVRFVDVGGPYSVPVGLHGIGSGGAWALWWSGAPGDVSHYLSDVDAGSSTEVREGEPIRLGTTDDFLAGERVIRLDTGESVPLGTGVSDPVVGARGVLTFTEGNDRSIKRYESEQGVTTLATSSHAFGRWSDLALIDFDGLSGTLVRIDRDAGSLVTLAPRISLVHRELGDGHAILLQDASAAELRGRLLLLDPTRDSVGDTGLDGRGSDFAVVLGDRMGLNAGSEEERGFFVGSVEGGFVRAGPPADEIEWRTAAAPLLFRSGSTWYLEHGADPIAVCEELDVDPGRLAFTPAFDVLLYTSNSSAADRRGTWRLDLD